MRCRLPPRILERSFADQISTHKFVNKCFNAIETAVSINSYIYFTCFHWNFFYFSSRGISSFNFSHFSVAHIKHAMYVCDRYTRIRAPDLVEVVVVFTNLLRYLTAMCYAHRRTVNFCSPGGYALARRFN